MYKFFNRNKHLLDITAISLSFLCLIHCLALPLLIAVLPLWGMQFVADEHVHVVLLFFALPVSTLGLWLGARCYRHRWYMLIGFTGLALMLFATVSSAEVLEHALTVGGVLLVAVAHILNWSLTRVSAS
jgi:hypothetical protein